MTSVSEIKLSEIGLMKLGALLCLHCRYEWKKNGLSLMLPVNKNMWLLPGTGSLFIQRALLEHEGIYECSAVNDFGAAIGMKVVLKKAGL